MKALQDRAIEQLVLIRRLEGETAVRAILAGLALWRIKASLPHGEFGPWIENCAAVRRSQANNYMRLAAIALVRMRATKVELRALPTDSVEIEIKGYILRSFVARLEKFVGECSLNELLVKHGIKGITRDTGDGAEGDNAAPVDDNGQLYFSEVAEALHSVRERLLKPESLMRLRPQQLDAINVEMESAIARWRKLYAEARGSKARGSKA